MVHLIMDIELSITFMFIELSITFICKNNVYDSIILATVPKMYEPTEGYDRSSLCCVAIKKNKNNTKVNNVHIFRLPGY